MWSRASSSASASLVTSPSQNRLQTDKYLSQRLLWLISCLSLWPHCVHPFQTASFFCRHTYTSYPPCLNKNLWPTLFLLLCSKELHFASFWHPSHLILPCLVQDCVKNLPIQTIPQHFLNYVPPLTPPPSTHTHTHSSPPPPPSLLVPFLLCARVCVCVGGWVRA